LILAEGLVLSILLQAFPGAGRNIQQASGLLPGESPVLDEAPIGLERHHRQPVTISLSWSFQDCRVLTTSSSQILPKTPSHPQDWPRWEDKRRRVVFRAKHNQQMLGDQLIETDPAIAGVVGLTRHRRLSPKGVVLLAIICNIETS
jgi:hypothetical protein